MLENIRPGVMARLALDYAAARTVKPDVIYLSITGFGQSGPYADRPALDTHAVLHRIDARQCW
jgi:crotonobetainyl-CoA:carnitine CoA-transferase CaiB-like acyl-CoA transferase